MTNVRLWSLPWTSPCWVWLSVSWCWRLPPTRYLRTIVASDDALIFFETSITTIGATGRGRGIEDQWAIAACFSA